MEENMKSKIIAVLCILMLLFFVGALKSCGNAYRQKQARDKEMASRLDLEEKINKLSQEKSALEEKFQASEKKLHDLDLEYQQAKKALAQEQLVTQGLKEELTKAASAPAEDNKADKSKKR